MLPVVWLPEADAELKEALLRYENVRPELALRFAQAVVDSIESICAAPLHYRLRENGRRRAGVHRFPYGIFYLLENETIVIVGCFHGRRDPKHWMSRQ